MSRSNHDHRTSARDADQPRARKHRGNGRRSPQARSRHGIILLFVMALLALFALVTVTFVIVAHSHREATGVAARVERNIDFPKAMIDRAVSQILVGTNDPNSPLRPHGLFEDIYGNDGLLGTVTPTPDSSNGLPPAPWSQYGQLLRFYVRFDNPPAVAAVIGAMSGRVLTFTTGQLKGNSFRVVSFDSQPNMLVMTVLAEDIDATVAATQLAQGDRILVNGRPFNGTGFGFDVGSNMQGVLTRAATPLSTPQATDSTFPFLGAIDPLSTGEYALLPNAKFFNPSALYLDPAGPGGADEEYDAADMQDMLLGFERVPLGSAPNVAPVDAPVAIPSLHRPELIHYWMQRIAAASSGAVSYPPTSPAPTNTTFAQLWNTQGVPAQRILRRAMMRPVGGFPGADHPDFTGSNSSSMGFDPVLGGRAFDLNSDGVPDDINGDGIPDTFYWDVDNDGDGIPDSIWVDIGLPPRAGPDGRMIKPLVAILCLDQDGKLNLNAHGNLAQSQEMIRDYTVASGASSDPTIISQALMNWPLPLPNSSASADFGYRFPPAGSGGTPPTSVILPEGSGYGPAEINLRPLFVTNPAEYQRLLQGWPTNAIDWPSAGSQSVRVDGRYGETQLWAANASLLPFPMPGGTLSSSIPFDPRVGWQARWRQFDFPYSFWETQPFPTSVPVPDTKPATSYSTPPDLNGDGSVAYDTHGQAMYRNMGEGNIASSISEKLSSPYDIDLSRRAKRGRSVGGTTQVAGIDSPFMPAEWERLLRYNDIDAASMPRRLLDLANSAFETGAAPGQPPNLVQAAINRRFVTTESWDVNVPSLLPTMELGGEIAATGQLPANLNVGDLIFSRLRSSFGGPAFISSTSDADIAKANFAMQRLLPWEVLSGSKMDVNRPFGNGRDDTLPNNPGFGIVDEPLSQSPGGQLTSEVIGPDRKGRPGEYLWDDDVFVNPVTLPAGVRMDHNNDGTFNMLAPTKAASPGASLPNLMNAETNDLLARQLYARHIYVLMCSLIDAKLVETIKTIHNLADTDGDDQWAAVDVYRRFAQWAVNIVDARDSDSIMTPFEFDANPFKDDSSSGQTTWNVDDNPATVEGPTSGASVYRGVVWGCERPELLMTESIAWHDRRTADTQTDTGARNSVYQPSNARPPDTTFDQVARPQGGLFIELYVPWNAPAFSQASAQATLWGTGSQPPAEFYELQSGRYAFHLNRTAPNGDPVWRMAVVNDERDVDETPDNPRSQAPNPTKIDRTIYFTTGVTNISNISPATEEPFFRQGAPANVYIAPGSYAVVGGTDLSAGNTPTSATTIRGQAGQAGSKVTLDMTPNVGAGQYPVAVDNNGAQIQNTLGRPDGPTAVVVNYTSNGPRRLSLSEPYKGSAGDNYTTEDDAETLNVDIPWDDTNQILLQPPTKTTKNGTVPRKFTVFLQRLANPLLAWNPDDPGHPRFSANRPVNPYITVDMTYVDLTVYNSQPPQTAPPGGQLEPGVNSTPAGNQAFRFSTRERGFMDQGRPNIWSNRFSEPGDPSQAGQEPAANAPTKLDKESLGYLNRVFGTPLAGGNSYDSALATAVGSGAKLYQGDPQVPFPALPWFNRPFANQYELMLVTALHPFELLHGFGCRDPIVSTTNVTKFLKNPYLIPVSIPPNNDPIPNDDPFRVVPYGILGPFFMSQVVPSGLGGIQPPAYSLPNLFRFFDFFQVPSRFAGTDTVLNPTPLAATAFGVDPSPPSLPPENMARRLYPPFNRVPRFREPGKVNINTIANAGVWAGLVNGTSDTPFGSLTPAQQTYVQWVKVMLSRRGSTPDLTSIPAFLAKADPVPNLLVDPPRDIFGGLLPTYFAAPFRSYAGVYLVPTANMRLFNGGLFKPTSGSPIPIPRNEIDATLMRLDQFTAMTPLFSNSVSVNPTTFQTNEVTGPPFADPVGNASTYLKSLHKLGGLTTTRSNVYAVWVTLGFFECDQVPIDEGHPDGYRLGREAAIDTGEVRRHRAFFIVDRSIPVGFQRGEAHNTEKAVLLRRFIE